MSILHNILGKLENYANYAENVKLRGESKKMQLCVGLCNRLFLRSLIIILALNFLFRSRTSSSNSVNLLIFFSEEVSERKKTQHRRTIHIVQHNGFR